MTNDNDARGALANRAAHLLECYAEWIRKNVMAANLEEHPYLPELEGVAEDLRGLPAGDGLTEREVDAAMDAFNSFPCPANGSVVRTTDRDHVSAAIIAARLAAPRQPGEMGAGMEALAKLGKELGTIRWMSAVEGDPWDQAIEKVRERIAEIIKAGEQNV